MSRGPSTTRIRGSHVGFTSSYENGDNALDAPSILANYQCMTCGNAMEHHLHPEAAIPRVWPCRWCSDDAEYVGDDVADGESLRGSSPLPRQRTKKTHWDQVRERRSDAELDVLLQRRLTALREGRLHVSQTGLEPR